MHLKRLCYLTLFYLLTCLVMELFIFDLDCSSRWRDNRRP